MKPRHLLALCGATIAVVAAPAAVALAATAVTVRVEGSTKTLLAATSVNVPSSGSITKGGAPHGSCPVHGAAGALDIATHHRWNGTYSSGLGIEVTQILGETHTFSRGAYWSIWVDNRFAQAGICGLTLHRGEQLLFAPYPATGTVYPIVLKGPILSRVGSTVTVSAGYWSGTKFKPLAGARVHGGGFSAITDPHGRVRIPISRAGTLVLGADEHGYIRSAPLRLREQP